MLVDADASPERTQMQWIAINIPVRTRSADGATMKDQSFVYHPMCRAGVVIEIRGDNSDPDKIERLLIGHINMSSGGCDCCPLNDEAVVLRAFDLTTLPGISEFVTP